MPAKDHDQTEAGATLAALLHAGERIAQATSAHQATLAPSPALARAFTHQSAQETLHASLCALAMSGARPRSDHPAMVAMAAYEHGLQSDLRARDLGRSLIGLQIVLESLGRLVFDRVCASATGNTRLRAATRLVERDERAHCNLGAVAVRKLIAGGNERAERLREAQDEYVFAATRILYASSDLFVLATVDPAHYAGLLHRVLPSWSRA